MQGFFLEWPKKVPDFFREAKFSQWPFLQVFVQKILYPFAVYIRETKVKLKVREKRYHNFLAKLKINV